MGDAAGNSQCPYQQKNSLQKRQRVREKLAAMHPDRLPVVLTLGGGAEKHITLTRSKFLVHDTTKVSQFLSRVRQQHAVGLDPSAAMFLMWGEQQALAPMTDTMAQVHARHGNKGDDTLYGHLVLESTFGAI